MAKSPAVLNQFVSDRFLTQISLGKFYYAKVTIRWKAALRLRAKFILSI